MRLSIKPKPKKNALQSPAEFRENLTRWFEKNAKDYPWRRTQNAYEILVSEVMLQQTQIATVLGRGFYQRFLDRFPDIESLAAADDEPLLKAWEGLGYYRRARMLRGTARAVLAEHQGEFPTQLASLMKLPGIGRYTAGAIRAFAFDLPAAVVDGNVSRVLSRIQHFTAPIDDGKGQKQLWEWAEVLADPLRSRMYHSALMELGQQICRPGRPDCLNCPVANFCQTLEPENLPVKRLKTIITELDEHALWLRDEHDRVLLHQESGKRRQGLWKLPTRTTAEISSLPILDEHRYTITRYRVNLRIHDGRSLLTHFQPQEGEFWHHASATLALPMPSPFRRAIERLLVES